MNIAEKTQALKEMIASKGSMLISFSGGVDSALLAVLATEVLGNNTRCVLLDSPVVPRAAIAAGTTDRRGTRTRAGDHSRPPDGR